jgi:membrane protease YdiL (CAAX protease family)
MVLFFTALLVCGATALLLTAPKFLSTLQLTLHSTPFLNGILQYQLVALLIAGTVTVCTLVLTPRSRTLLAVGNLSIKAEQERLLGINGNDSWRKNALQLLFIISLATAVFMGFAVQATGNLNNFRWSFVPWIVLFSFTNALSEELIFRFAINGNLHSIIPKAAVLLVSALAFGLPHYNGFPNGVLGVIMAGVLGYVLSKATFETGGLGIALGIHFVQDVIIFSAMMMMNVK